VSEPTVPYDGAAVAQIRAALDGGGQLVALDVLGLVLRWSLDVLRADSLAAPGAAFRAVAAADRALAPAPALFATLMSLVAHGEPSPEVAADLDRHAERLAELKRRTAPQRERLAALQEAEERLRAETACQEEIAADIAELERVERLAADVGLMRQQRDRLEERARNVAVVVTTADAELKAAGDHLISVSNELLASLASDTSAVLIRAREQDRMLQDQLAEHRAAIERATAETEQLRAELAEAEAGAAAARARHESLHAEADARLAALRRHAAADQAVAEALAGWSSPGSGEEVRPSTLVEEAVRGLTEVDVRLTEIDELLGRVLNADEHDDVRGAAGASSAVRTGEG